VLKVRVWGYMLLFKHSLSTFETAPILTMKRDLVSSSERALWTKISNEFSCDGQLRADVDGYASCD
jgi:hypothetical protein